MFIMNESNTTKQVTRRRFVLISAASGAAVLAGLYWITPRRRGKSAGTELGDSTVLFRNPAFRSGKPPAAPHLTATSVKGQPIAFRLDAEGKALWEVIPTAAEFHRGRQATVGQLLTLMVDKYRERDASLVRREASAFLQQALAAGVVLKPGAKVFEKYEPKRAA
jgi:hypothetical protein